MQLKPKIRVLSPKELIRRRNLFPGASGKDLEPETRDRTIVSSRVHEARLRIDEFRINFRRLLRDKGLARAENEQAQIDESKSVSNLDLMRTNSTSRHVQLPSSCLYDRNRTL